MSDYDEIGHGTTYSAFFSCLLLKLKFYLHVYPVQKVFVSINIYMARTSSYPTFSGSLEGAYFLKPSVNIVESKNKTQCV